MEGPETVLRQDGPVVLYVTVVSLSKHIIVKYNQLNMSVNSPLTSNTVDSIPAMQTSYSSSSEHDNDSSFQSDNFSCDQYGPVNDFTVEYRPSYSDDHAAVDTSSNTNILVALDDTSVAHMTGPVAICRITIQSVLGGKPLVNKCLKFNNKDGILCLAKVLI